MEIQDDDKSNRIEGGLIEEEDPRYFNLFINRLTYIKMIFMFLSIVIMALIFWNQFGRDSDVLVQIDDERSIHWSEDVPIRGTIYSDDHHPLAIDVLKYSLRFDPKAEGLNDNVFYQELKDSVSYKHCKINYIEFATVLSDVLKDKTPEEYADYLEKIYKNPGNKRNRPLTSRYITPLELSFIKKNSTYMRLYDANKNGIKIEQHINRMYPYGNVAARTIGVANNKNVLNSTGLEKTLNYRLSGRKGIHKAKQFSKNLWISQFHDNNISSQDGWDVVTTIDIDLQKFVQNDLYRQFKEVKAVWGTAIVMDVPTGDVKAVANVVYDKKKDTIYLEKPDSCEFYAIHAKIEPGSTFKTVAFTALIDLKHLSLDEMYNLDGSGEKYFKLAKHTITDDHKVGHVTFKQVLEQSSNIGMAMAVERHFSKSREEIQRFGDRIKEFGILRPLDDMDIPSTIEPTMRTPKDKNWSYFDFLVQSFGYAVDLTPMHIAMFYNGIANNGVMVKPRFVKSFEEKRTHNVIQEKEIVVLNPKLCESETLSKVKISLEGVVEKGTAATALKGCKFKCAGKTGTAKQHSGKGYEGTNEGIPYLGTFVGYFPADNPRYTVLVAYETMHKKGDGKPWSGAGLSAPVFKNIADFIYDRENALKPSSDNSYKVSKSSKPYASLGNADDLRDVAHNIGVNVSIPTVSGTSLVGIDSVGVVNREMTADSTGIINLVGCSLNDALDILHNQGIKTVVVGEGNVYKQSLRMNKGRKVVTLYLR